MKIAIVKKGRNVKKGTIVFVSSIENYKHYHNATVYGYSLSDDGHKAPVKTYLNNIEVLYHCTSVFNLSIDSAPHLEDYPDHLIYQSELMDLFERLNAGSSLVSGFEDFVRAIEKDIAGEAC